MMKQRRIAALAMLASIIIAATPAMFYVQGQIQASPAEELVKLADRAEQQVKSLIDLVYANETALQTIEDFGLLDELEGNVTLYNQGAENLAEAHSALESTDYEGAIANATEALRIFREVFRSIHIILEDAGLQKGHLVDSQGLLEAITRSLERIDRLRAILPADATEALELLDQAEAYLDIDAARELLLEGKASQVVSNLEQANQLISQVYQYLKGIAEESNTWRIHSYCQGIQERTRERFRYGSQQGINVTAFLESLGYQSENEFMETLQNMTQIAQGKTGDFKSAMLDLEAISQMVQQMDQALVQEINRRQGSPGYGGGGSGSGAGSGFGYGGK
jgi:hypothetical protein